jgi:hypothetical protein
MKTRITLELGEENGRDLLLVQCTEGQSVAAGVNDVFAWLWKSRFLGEVPAAANPNAAPRMELIFDPSMRFGRTGDGELVLSILHPLRGWMEFVVPPPRYHQILTILRQMEQETRQKPNSENLH